MHQRIILNPIAIYTVFNHYNKNVYTYTHNIYLHNTGIPIYTDTTAQHALIYSSDWLHKNNYLYYKTDSTVLYQRKSLNSFGV